LKVNRIGGFVIPACPQDCSLAGEMSVVKQGPSKPLAILNYENTWVAR
jgi:hypothetical protein